MPYKSDVQRITRALNWIGIGALALGIVVVVWALWWTQGVEDFRTAVIVAALGFGLPSIVALALAWLLEPLWSGPADEDAKPAPASRRHTGLRGWPRVVRYMAAIIAVVAATYLRFWLDPFIGDTTPYITFFLAVTVAAWVGGFGASALATALSIGAAWQWFVRGHEDLPADLLANIVTAGVFAATALTIGGITAALRSATETANRLSDEARVHTAELQSIEGALRHERDRLVDESRIRAIADNAPVLIWMADATGSCNHFNQQWLDFTGATLDQMLDAGWIDAIHPEDRESRRAAFKQAHEDRKPFRLQYRLRRFDGEYRHVLDEGVPRFTPAGEFAGYIGACMDVTERTRGALAATA